MPQIVYIGVIFISYLSQVWAQGDPAIVGDIKPVVKPYNGAGTLVCTVVNIKSSHIVYWIKDVTHSGGKDYFISENNKIVVPDNEEQGNVQDGQLHKYDIEVRPISNNRWSYALTVRHLREVDSGNYSCKIRSVGQAGYMATKKAYLMVQVAPTIRDGMKATQTVEIGGNVSLTCTAMGQPTPNITWRREDGNPLSTGGFQKRGANLNLINIQKKDAGNYLCVADNSVKPPATFKVHIGVIHAPTCFAVQNTVGQAQNRRFNARFECIVSGYPKPTVQWQRIQNGGRVNINDNEKFATERMDSPRNIVTNLWYVLTIRNVQASDYTEYFCVARNTYGSSEINFELFETPDCQISANCPSFSTGGACTVCACTVSLLFSVLVICLLKLIKY